MEGTRIGLFGKIIFISILFVALWAGPEFGQKNFHYAYNISETKLSEMFNQCITESSAKPVLLDNGLSAAALSYNRFIRTYGETAISDRVVSFILNRQGLYDFVLPIVVSKKRTVSLERLLNQKIKSYLKTGDFNAYGISVLSEGERDTVVILLARRYLQLDKLSMVNYSGQLKLSGKLLDKFFNLRLFVLDPDKKVQEFCLSAEQGVFEFPYSFDGPSGRYLLQIVGDDIYGTLTLALFPVYYNWPVEDEKKIAQEASPSQNNYSRSELEDELIRNIEGLRRASGLPPLHYNTVLAQTAATHSTDMAVNSFFSQGSYTEQRTIRQLLDDTTIEYSAYGVNIVMGRSLAEIENNLSTLPYNRQNRLSPENTDFGVGVAVETNEDGLLNYYVTEIFIRKKDTKFYTSQKDQLLRLLNEKRNFRRLAPLRFAEKYTAYAQVHAEEMAELDALSYVLADGKNIEQKYKEIQGLKKATVKVFAAHDLKNIESAEIYDPQYNKVAIGYAAADSAKYGPATSWIVVVLLQE